MAFEYTVKGKVVRLPISHEKVAVRFREPSDLPARRAVIEPMNEVGSFDNRYEVPNEKLTVIDVPKTDHPGPATVAAAVDALVVDPAIERAAPVFVVGDRNVVAPNRLIVGFKPNYAAQADQIIQSTGGEIIRQLGDGNEYVVRLNPSAEPFDVAANLNKRVEVEYAEPDFVTIGPHGARTRLPGGGEPTDSGNSSDSNIPGPSAPGNDPLLQFQYAARLTGAVNAWQASSGSPAIKIAIIDEGVDVNHPDLKDVIVGTFDAVDLDDDQQPNPWDAHGTACAGLAAAIAANGVGVRGMGGGCSLLAVRIASSPARGAHWSWAEQHAIDGIDWAWKNGADILSNSWGGGAPSNGIINAFERARLHGRSNRGCVILVAAGNDSGPVSFPADLDNVLTVAASNEFDEPKTFNSADGEDWWGSNFGPEVDVAAPGVHNYTTDIVGSDGYNTSGPLDLDYVSNFNGTSSATPIVAGIVGLVLSVNPSLREEQVRRLLKQTADKVGPVVYANGRNDQMGNGRVNALRAIQSAAGFV